MKLTQLISLWFLIPSWLSIAADSPSDCKRARNELNETKLLFALGDEMAKCESWSPDLLTRIILEIRGPYLSCCKDPLLEKKAEVLEGIYLKKLLGTEVLPQEREKLFRGLLTLKDDFSNLKAKLEKEKIIVKTVADLQKIYAATDTSGSIVLVSESKVDFGPFKAFLKEMSEKSQRPDLLLDPSSLFKIMITDTPGVAAFVPEIAILVLSKELIESLNPLKKLVIVHELAHVALSSAWNHTRVDWKEEFKTFSGWEFKRGNWQVKVERKKRTKGDTLSELSKESPYSILPDDLVWGVKGKQKLDGFVFEKSHKASLEQNDISEDIADSIAAYFIEPARFCDGKNHFAPKKRAWVQKNVFGFENGECR